MEIFTLGRNNWIFSLYLPPAARLVMLPIKLYETFRPQTSDEFYILLRCLKMFLGYRKQSSKNFFSSSLSPAGCKQLTSCHVLWFTSNTELNSKSKVFLYKEKKSFHYCRVLNFFYLLRIIQNNSFENISFQWWGKTRLVSLSQLENVNEEVKLWKLCYTKQITQNNWIKLNRLHFISKLN